MAQAYGAQRIELCVALEVGGLTPSIGLMIEARKVTRLPIMAMVRPRAGGFVYDAHDAAVMARDAQELLDAGADGLVAGALTSDGGVDRALCTALLEFAAGRPVTFHRAFDLTSDPETTLDALIELGVTRILTSGHAVAANEGAAEIARMVERARGRIVIMPGGGLNEANVAAVVRQTGCRDVHASLSSYAQDATAETGSPVRVGSAAGSGTGYRILDDVRVRRMRSVLDALESEPAYPSLSGAENA